MPNYTQASLRAAVGVVHKCMAYDGMPDDVLTGNVLSQDIEDALWLHHTHSKCSALASCRRCLVAKLTAMMAEIAEENHDNKS